MLLLTTIIIAKVVEIPEKTRHIIIAFFDIYPPTFVPSIAPTAYPAGGAVTHTTLNTTNMI